MQLLRSVIYAAHARGTHHKLALDALGHMRIGEAEDWNRVFLKHAPTYLEGSKAPDTEFKDFKNHVLHVGDNYWGGAPEKVESWYQLLVRALREGNWSEAAWCAGIMSHYYSDPVHPFHTAQSDAENAIHRAVEWSISKSYDDLKIIAAGLPKPDVEPRSGPGWIKAFVISSAEHANKHYAALIAHYDLHRGIVDPPAGLDFVSRPIVAGLIDYAGQGIARLLDRAIVESGAKPPEVSLTLETIVATLKVPMKLVLRKMADGRERRQVEAMYDELMATGRVEKTLSEDDRMVRDLYALEVIASNKTHRDDVRSRRATADLRAQGQFFANKGDGAAASANARIRSELRTDEQATKVMEVRAESSLIAESQAPEPQVPRTLRQALSDVVEQRPATNSTPAERVERPTGTALPRKFLTASDNVEAAPSIGPRMAERLSAVGVKSVGDLLGADPDRIAKGLADNRFSAQVIRDWQAQAKLVCDVPGLRGSHAQLIVGAGFPTADKLAAAEPAVLQGALLRFAATSQGQRVLRESAPPDLERITAWIANARSAQSRAA